MKQLKYSFFIIFSAQLLFAWGKTGHRTVGEIAQYQLTPNTLKQITLILGDPSLAVASTWADEMRSNPDFKPYDPWHYANMPLDREYHEIKKSEKGDIVQAIDLCINKLKDPKTTQEDKAFYLKYLTHFVGDIHQPMHAGRAEDKGGNDVKIRWFGQSSNLHRLWDSDMIDDYQMSYTELAQHLMATRDKTEIETKDAHAWIFESHQYTKEIYGNITENAYLSYNYIYDNFDLVKDRLFIAGIRLGNLLNSIFDE